MNKSELKPCPFCGAEAKNINSGESIAGFARYDYIHCSYCGAEIRTSCRKDGYNDAVDVWNSFKAREHKQENQPMSCPFCGSADVKIEDSIKQFSKVFEICCNKCKCSSGYYDTKIEAIEAWNRRAEQTGEWLTGEWLEDEYGYCRCSICGYEHDGPETTTPYCPNCGAKMESEDK